ncbi:protein O-linked-mannose beta-1,2-N-acetylglucosaminyltransferase 1-like [Mytilus californianus]|uniref:protein O-linked-mannose beta-1,2-N-acetylglucosaminyltransferase 1-like n=1 Tax=Mytilus californianus TaxID=6549 RepID=UPI0022473A43|nr:protein O-linked-mannose beta-1,2-N-acetylglucosaminyltransferase 1-like [Mytilus californianus]
MDNWIPNTNAKPFIPKRLRNSAKSSSSGITEFSKRKCISKIFQGGIVVVLIVTIVINITFILETSRKMNDPQKMDEVNSGFKRKEGKGNEVEMTKSKFLSLEVQSSKTSVVVKVDETVIIQDEEFEKNRGIHIAVLNQATGSVMSKNIFDTYSQHEDEALLSYLKKISNGRIIVFTIKDEASFHLKLEARQYLKEMGSEKIENLAFRDTWAFIVKKGGRKIAETHGKSPALDSWGEKVTIQATIDLVNIKDSECHWGETKISQRRQTFCNKVEGYGDICSCTNPDPVVFPQKKLIPNNIGKVPIVIIASDRPHYLFRMLKNLLQIPGADPKMITVFIDGYFDEPLQVTKLFGLRGIQHTPLGVKNARVSQHYKASLTATFNLYPESKYAIIVEEDLDVSPDFLNYFSQTIHLLEEDDTLYCISAWNDQGYNHSCKDETLLYRIETMPGLGWLLKRKLYKNELEPQWPTPEKQWDWDMWMRTNMIRKDRECIIPDISRTYHFGSKGLNMNPYFQEVYFKKHSFLTKPNVKLKGVDRMKKDAYEELIVELIKSSVLLDHSLDPCKENFLPHNQAKPHLMYISMNISTDYVTWKQLAKCYHLWDLDVRGFHKSMWRLFINGTPVIMVGVPASPYRVYKPENIKPIYIPEPTKKT